MIHNAAQTHEICQGCLCVFSRHAETDSYALPSCLLMTLCTNVEELMYVHQRGTDMVHTV